MRAVRMKVTSNSDSFRFAVKNSSLSRFPGLVVKEMRHWTREIVIALAVVFPVVFVAASYCEDLVEAGGKEGFGDAGALITGLPSHVTSGISNAGYPGVFFLTLLDSAGFPLPSEIILPFAGYLVFQGVLQYWPVVLCSTVAALLGSSIDYYIGRKLGSSLIAGKVRLPYIPVGELQRVQAWFDKHGPVAVALLRLVPAARVLISFPAGACRMRPVTFEVCTLAGCLMWNVSLVYLGWWLGSSWGVVASLSRYASLFVYPVMAVFVFWLVSRRSEHRNASKLSKNDLCDPS
jgi:membrane protein DedA with SNARE-associated domain